YHSQDKLSCAGQLLAVFARTAQSVIGLTVMPGDIIQKAGCVTGVWQEPQSLLKVTQLYEKPTLDYAIANLHVAGMAESAFLGVFGMYVLKPEIFDHLEAEIENNLRYRGEFQLTTCLERLRAAEGMAGYVVKGQPFDVGMPEFYRRTMRDFYQAADQV
ncbi:MAG: UTP--glucose-1-phosphate uridylyltransferase, partial [Cyanobacteria bacterium P01_D01_bin.14]